MRTRILFVDDDPRVERDLRRLLRPFPSGWTVEFARSGARTLERMGTVLVDVLVVDARVPDIDALSLLQEVRARHPGAVRVLAAGPSDEPLVLRSLGTVHRYLAKPCDASSLREAVEAASRLRVETGDPALRLALTALAALPSPSPHREMLAAELRAPAWSPARVAAIVERDAGLTAQVLRLWTALHGGSGHPMVNATVAATLLGLQPLHAVLGATETLDLASPPMAGATTEVLAHGVTVAGLARDLALAEGLPTATADTAYTAGLLHDVGHILLALAPRPRPRRMLSMQTTAGAAPERQAGLFNACHAEVAGALLGLWGLPSAVVEAVVYHHRPSLTPVPWTFGAAGAVHVADGLVHALEPGSGLALDMTYLDATGMASRLDRWKRLAEPRAVQQTA